MNDLHCRHVVLGAGAMGSAAAYQLASRGEPVLLVEQFAMGHERGSSHSQARITRHSYADVRYARLMVPAFQAWRDLEAASGQSLYYRTGGVTLCPPDVDYVDRVTASLDAVGIPHLRTTGKEWNRLHPQFALPASDQVVFEPDAGMLAASRAVSIQTALAAHHGAVLKPETPVLRIDLEANRPILITKEAQITADRLVIAAGSWAPKLLPGLAAALTPTYQQVLYFRPPESSASAHAMGELPVFIYKGNSGPWDAFYGMPPFGGYGVKVARHGGPVVDPDTVDRTIEPSYHDVVRQWLRRALPGLAVAPIDREETCLYTVAPEEHFLVGPLPGRPDVILASPCSGHGFKFSALIGRILADLAISGSTDLDIALWSVPAAR